MRDLVNLLHCLQGGGQRDRKGPEFFRLSLGGQETTHMHGRPDPEHRVFTACFDNPKILLATAVCYQASSLPGRQS